MGIIKDFLNGVVDDWYFRGFDENPDIAEGTGRCTKCGATVVPWEDGWNGKDFSYHYPEYDAGGGDVERKPCGPVIK